MPRYVTAKPKQITVTQPRQVPIQGTPMGMVWHNETERQNCCATVAAYLILILMYLAIYAHVVYHHQQ